MQVHDATKMYQNLLQSTLTPAGALQQPGEKTHRTGKHQSSLCLGFFCSAPGQDIMFRHSLEFDDYLV